MCSLKQKNQFRPSAQGAACSVVRTGAAMGYNTCMRRPGGRAFSVSNRVPLFSLLRPLSFTKRPPDLFRALGHMLRYFLVLFPWHDCATFALAWLLVPLATTQMAHTGTCSARRR